MSALPASSQTVVAYLGYLLESVSISAKSLQPYLIDINAVHNDFEYPPPECGYLVKLARKGFAELQGSSMLQPQQVTTFPAEHMLTIVMYGLRPNASKHHIRVCACLATQFVFFSRADSGVLLTVINAQVSNTTLSINQAAKNITRNQGAPSSRVSSVQDDPDNCFNKLQLRWSMLRNHRDTDLYWFFEDDPVSLSKNSGIITGASAAHVIGVSIAVIMAWGLWKSRASELLYIDVSVRPSSEALFFFGHLLTRFNLPQAPLVRQTPPPAVSSSIDLSDALEELLEFDD